MLVPFARRVVVGGGRSGHIWNSSIVCAKSFFAHDFNIMQNIPGKTASPSEF